MLNMFAEEKHYALAKRLCEYNHIPRIELRKLIMKALGISDGHCVNSWILKLEALGLISIDFKTLSPSGRVTNLTFYNVDKKKCSERIL